MSEDNTTEKFRADFNSANIRYGDMKKQLAEDMVKFITPIRKKAEDIRKNEDYLKKIMKAGAEKARESAQKTINQARELIGLNYF